MNYPAAPMAADTLATAVVRFNLDPVSYCHASWWPHRGAPAQLFRQAVTAPAAAAKLSQIILRHYGIDAQFDYDFEQPYKRVALLPYPQQKRLIYLLGLVVYRARLAPVIAAAQQRRLLQAFGPADYTLALRLPLRHKYASADFLPALPCDNLLRCRVLVYAAGLTLLTNILQQEADAYKRRFYFTWPKPLALRRLAARHGAAHAGPRRWSSLEDYALYCSRHLNDPALVDEGRKLLGALLAPEDG